MKTNLQRILFIAGWYNLIWGTIVILFPNLLFEISNITLPTYSMIWQSVGLVVGVYGLGYIWASKDYNTHWPIVMVGFLGKLGGPIGIIFHVFILKDLSIVFCLVSFFNDVIWWIPFFLMLKEAYQTHQFKK